MLIVNLCDDDQPTSMADCRVVKYRLTLHVYIMSLQKDQLKDLGLRKQWFTSAEIMIQATGNGSKIVGLSGERNPYGKIGVIEEKAMADILIYSKNPLKDVSIVEDHENNLKLIIKDGKVYKNTL